MPAVRFRLLAACAVALSLPALAAVAGTVTQTNIVANDASFKALVTDPTLVNPWGISTEPGGPFWLSDNGTGISPVYSVAGSKLLTVTIPPPAGKSGPSAPTGQVFNSATSDFVLSNKKPAAFIFDTEDGTISGWNGGSSAVLAVDNSASGAVYKGLALAPVSTIAYLLATNFHAGVVEVYNGSFQLVSTYRSPKLPKLYAPFNVAVLGANIFVTYALQDALKHDDVPGKGHGYLDQVTLNSKGKLKFMRRIQANGPLNSPWGLAIAPSTLSTARRSAAGRQFRQRRDQCLQRHLRRADRAADGDGQEAAGDRRVVVAVARQWRQRRQCQRRLFHRRTERRSGRPVWQPELLGDRGRLRRIGARLNGPAGCGGPDHVTTPAPAADRSAAGPACGPRARAGATRG